MLGVLVVRPDSGDPPEVVVKVLNLLGSAFGTTKNLKGYDMLPPYLRIIQVSYHTYTYPHATFFLKRIETERSSLRRKKTYYPGRV